MSRLSAVLLSCALGALPLASLAQEAQSPAEIAAIKRAVFDDPAAPVMGNPAGRVTLVEFSDYNCGFCRKAMPEVAAFLQANPDVKLVVHEVPIFGEGSHYAAMAALAAARQGRYPEFHRALMGMAGKAEKPSVLREVRRLGLDMARFERDMVDPKLMAQIEANLTLADQIGLQGTPSFIAGDRAVFGYLPQADLKDLVDEARGTRK